MNLVREGMDFEDFFELVMFGIVIIALVFLLFACFLGPLIWWEETKKKQNQYDLYLALSGETTENEEAIKTANLLSTIHHQDSDSVTLGEVKEVWDSDDSYFKVAMKNYDDVKEILEGGPSIAEIEVDVLTWSDYFVKAGIFMWLFSAGAMSVTYLFASIEHARDPLTYPWKNAWSWPMILLMFPYLIITQPILFICYGFWKWRERKKAVETTGSEEENQLVERERILHEEKIKFQKQVSSVNERKSENRQKWIEVCGKRLSDEASRLKDEIASSHKKISRYGQGIAEEQRTMAESQTKLKSLEEVIKARSPEREEEFGFEFDKLLELPMVSAIEITDEEIQVYTNTVYMKYRGRRYEIGDFLIRIIDTDLIIENLRNTNSFESSPYHPIMGYHHPYIESSGQFRCLDYFNSYIARLCVQREYFPLVVSVLEALQSVVEPAIRDVRLWKEV